MSATNTTSYSVFSGALPTGLSLNTSTGAITGTPTAQGSYSFVIRATGSGGNTNTSTLTIVINPPGRRFTGSSTSVALTNMKRHNGSSFVDVTIVRRFTGSAWVDVTNN